MHPNQELSQLAAHKIVLRRRIARHRAELAEATDVVIRPLRILDHGIAMLRKYARWAPLAIIAIGYVAKRPHRISQWRPVLRFSLRTLALLLAAPKPTV